MVIEAIVLVVVIAVLTLESLRNTSSNPWFEQRLPWLFSEPLAQHLEAVAAARPVNFAAILFLVTLGALAVAHDLGASFGPLLRYGTAAAVAGFSLAAARKSAAERAA